MADQKIPAREYQITIQGYTISTRITQGKIIDFESNKVLLAGGFYNSITDPQALNMIDCSSALMAFFPEIKAVQKIDIKELDPIDIKEIFIEMEGFFTWYGEWRDFMNDYKKEEPLKKPEEKPQ